MFKSGPIKQINMKSSADAVAAAAACSLNVSWTQKDFKAFMIKKKKEKRRQRLRTLIRLLNKWGLKET